MALISTILIPSLIALLLVTIVLAFIYLIPILLIRRFRTLNNIFTVNVCFAVICCDAYWLSSFLIFYIFPYKLADRLSCWFLDYFAMMCTIQVPLAVVEVSVHRACLVIYHTKPFFKKKQWAILCMSCQWTIGIIFSLPYLLADSVVCQVPIWLRIYGFLIAVIVPSFVCFIIHMIMFKYIRSSTRRVQPTTVATNNNQPERLSRRDLYLLRHMIIIFCIFVGGWSPAYLSWIIVIDTNHSAILWIFMVLADFCLLFDIVNLFVYNRPIRKYVLQKIFRC